MKRNRWMWGSLAIVRPGLLGSASAWGLCSAPLGSALLGSTQFLSARLGPTPGRGLQRETKAPGRTRTRTHKHTHTHIHTDARTQTKKKCYQLHIKYLHRQCRPRCHCHCFAVMPLTSEVISYQHAVQASANPAVALWTTNCFLPSLDVSTQ